MSDNKYLEEVKDQYEDFPFPLRDPQDEKKRLLATSLGYLPRINFHCFKGQHNFENFRVLVAGGGTGDNTIFMAEQLKDKNAEVVHLDLSTASIEIAKQRAKARNLNNIKWIQKSILELPELGLGKFDYVDCNGVLHHLENPDAGLAAIREVLDDNHGSMGIMLYGKYGRLGLYPIQDMMRIINQNENANQAKIDNTKRILANLPQSNWHTKRAYNELDDCHKMGDTGIYDMFLHSQDRPYTVPEIYEFLEGAGLHLADFENNVMYMPDPYIKDQNLYKKIKNLPLKDQQAIAELICGFIAAHTFYASVNPDSRALPNELENVPFYFSKEGDEALCSTLYNLHNAFKENPGNAININLPQGINVQLPPGKYIPLILEFIDGDTSLAEIFNKIRDKLNQPQIENTELFQDFMAIYQRFNMLNYLLLRHKSVPRFKTYMELQRG